MHRLSLLSTLLGLFLFGCGHTVVRDTEVYKTEVAFLGQVATQQADLLEHFVTTHPDCLCNAEQTEFTDPSCQKAAKALLVARHRVPWHQAMMLHNAGVEDERPSETPPDVPDPSTLCPGDADEHEDD